MRNNSISSPFPTLPQDLTSFESYCMLHISICTSDLWAIVNIRERNNEISFKQICNKGGGAIFQKAVPLVLFYSGVVAATPVQLVGKPIDIRDIRIEGYTVTTQEEAEQMEHMVSLSLRFFFPTVKCFFFLNTS